MRLIFVAVALALVASLSSVLGTARAGPADRAAPAALVPEPVLALAAFATVGLRQRRTRRA